MKKNTVFFVILMVSILFLSACSSNGNRTEFKQENGTDTQVSVADIDQEKNKTNKDNVLEFQDSTTISGEKREVIQNESSMDTPSNAPQEEKTIVVGIGDSPYYSSLGELSEKADYIVYGKVLSKRYEWRSLRIKSNDTNPYTNPGGEEEDDLTLVTIYELHVMKHYDGEECESDRLEVLVIGGETNTMIYRVEGTPEITVDEPYVFFLRKSAIWENGTWLLNDSQSLYSTDGTNLFCVDDRGFDLSFEQLEKLGVG